MYGLAWWSGGPDGSTHTTVSAYHNRDWDRIYAVMRASMTLNPRYADINDLIAHLEGNAVKTKSDAPLQAKAATEEGQAAADDEAPSEVPDQRKASAPRRPSGKRKRKRKRLSSRLSGIFKRKKKENVLE